jgi:hypothetical protein
MARKPADPISDAPPAVDPVVEQPDAPPAAETPPESDQVAIVRDGHRVVIGRANLAACLAGGYVLDTAPPAVQG